MCLIIKKGQKASIATEDITCFKVLKKVDGKYITPYQDAKVNLGKLYRSKIEIDVTVPRITKALHSYVNLEDAVPERREQEYWYIYDYVIVKAIIPKGARYYISIFSAKDDSYASNKIEYIKEV